MFQDAEGLMQQFSHRGANDLHRRLAVFLQATSELFDNSIVAQGDNGRKVEGFAHSAVPQFGQIRSLQAGAGFLLARCDAGGGGYLSGIVVAREIQFAQQQLRRLFPNTGDGEQ